LPYHSGTARDWLLAALLGLLVWHALSLSHPTALLLLLTPGVELAFGSLAGGYLLAVLAIVAGLWRAASAEGSRQLDLR
jgi:hypothetical protein